MDPRRPGGAATGPFAGTIAHGYLTLSLGTALLWEVLEVTGSVRVINDGLDKVRFPAPVPVGRKWRWSSTWSPSSPSAVALPCTWSGRFRYRARQNPACVAEAIFRYYGATEDDRARAETSDRRNGGRRAPG